MFRKYAHTLFSWCRPEVPNTDCVHGLISHLVVLLLRSFERIDFHLCNTDMTICFRGDLKLQKLPYVKVCHQHPHTHNGDFSMLFVCTFIHSCQKIFTMSTMFYEVTEWLLKLLWSVFKQCNHITEQVVCQMLSECLKRSHDGRCLEIKYFVETSSTESIAEKKSSSNRTWFFTHTHTHTNE